jgi:ubiquinone/menaquinone biosynthesis C-methylase UbiE
MLLVADAQRLAIAAASFDVGRCSQAIGQLPDPAAAAGELHRVLRSGGRIGIQLDVSADPR